MFGFATKPKEEISRIDPITQQVSLALQEHERANARLKDALCETLDGPDCKCRALKVTEQ